jgi:hypothetical protein
LGALPGIVITLLAGAGAASGASPAPEWPFIQYAPGALTGSFVGLWTADRAGSRLRPRAAAWATALAGFLIGAGLSFVALTLVEKSDRGNEWLVLSPLATGMAALAGYAVLAPDGSDRART